MMIARLCLAAILAGCTISCAFWLVALACLRSVLRPRKMAGVPFEPMVSILKPVKGIDCEALVNFTTFCLQQYPRFELLFGVADAKDPIVAVIQTLQSNFPGLSIRLFVADPLGTNPKAATLHKLAAEANGEVLAICDSDIRVTPDFLRRVVQPLKDPGVGLVTCLYRGEGPRTLSARLEALHMDAAFAPSVALAWKMGTAVGLGATVVMRSEDLRRAGGYAGCADHLLDDYEIAVRIAGLGLRIHLSDYVVGSVLGPMQFTKQWAREVRWSRGIRVAKPTRYPGMVITFSLPLALVAAAFSGIWPMAWIAVPAVLAVRCFIGWQAAIALGQAERRYLVWLPLRDLLSMLVWCVGLFGRRVTWRGGQFFLQPDGRLEPVAEPALPSGLVARSIRRLDAYLRRRDGIFEYSQHRQCMLRVGVARAEADMAFSDGTLLRAGEPVGVLHLWNEHIATIPTAGPDLRWAMELRDSMAFSLRQLAEAAKSDPRLSQTKAFGGTAVFVSRHGTAQVARLAARYGFDWIRTGPPRTPARRVHDFFENFLVLGLQWAFNPAGLRGKRFIRPREPFWITRATLLAKYGPEPRPATEPVKLIAVA